MEIEKMSAGQYIIVGELTLLPIIHTYMSCRNVNHGIVCSGSKNLVGIVVISPKCRRAINVDGEEVPVKQYVEMVPEVRELLQSM